MPNELRAEVRRLHQTIKTTLDVAAKRRLAARALELAQQAEAIANLPDDVEGLRVRIAQYRHMLNRLITNPNSGLWRSCCGTPRASYSGSPTSNCCRDTIAPPSPDRHLYSAICPARSTASAWT